MRWSPILAVALNLAVFGCGGTDEPGSADGGDIVDAAGGVCGAPDLSPDWLTTMQSDVVAKLSGAQPISAGVTLSDRATEQNRARTQVYIEQEMAALGFAVERQVFAGNLPGTNVFAELAGSGEGIYILGAHFDSVAQSPGANDNATGVAAVLAAARILVDEQDCLEHGILFAFFDQEENGLIGSRAFAEQLVTDGRNVLGVITLDQLGWDDDADRRMEVELPGAGMLAAFEASIAARGLGVELIETSTAGSDHTAFRERGFAALGITEEYVSGDTTPHYHLSSDTFETVNLGYLASSTTVLTAYLSDLAIP